MRDITYKEGVVTFYKHLYAESELILAKCYNFHYDADSGTITANLRFTSEKALRNFVEIGYKNFSESVGEQVRRDEFWSQVGAYFAWRYDFAQQTMKVSLPYYGIMYAHQKESVAEALFKQHNFLALEMGLGKSLISASISRALKLSRTVIVAPNAVKFNWFRDLTTKFEFNRLYFSMYDATKSRSFKAFSERFVIINYDILSRFLEEICMTNIDHFIFDEFHMCKNHTTARSKAIFEMLSRYPNAKVTMLSGTPISNRVNDLFSYMKAIGHELGRSHKKFLEDFTVQTKGRGGERVTGGKNLQELHIKLANFMIRKTKAECLDLPDKIYFNYKYELDDYRAEYNKIIMEMSEAKEHSRLGSNLHSLNIITSKSKLPGIIELADSIIGEGRKVVIFGSYKDPMKVLEEHYGHQCVKIDGSVSGYMRDQYVQKFINDPECLVFLGNMVAAGVGINLVNASDVIFMNYPLVPAELFQSVDRLHRIGQTRSVNVHYTTCEDSIDQYIFELIQEKDQDIMTVIDNGKESQLSENFTERLIKKLLKRDDITFTTPHKKSHGVQETQNALQVFVPSLEPEKETNSVIAGNNNGTAVPGLPTENIFARKLREQEEGKRNLQNALDGKSCEPPTFD